MTTAIKRRRGTTAQHASFIGLEGELTVDTTKETVVVHDGATAGGFPLVGEKGNQTIAGTKTFSLDASISGLTVGKGSGSVGSNTTFGSFALNANTTGSALVALGQAALLSNTIGASNTAIGSDALRLNTTASNNTAVGHQAGYNNTTATNGVFIGKGAGYSVTVNNNNVMIGTNAGNLTTGPGNVFIGTQAGQSVTTGLANCFVGSAWNTNGSGYDMTTGTKNTILGSFTGNQGGLDIRTASNYIVLSDGDGNPLAYVQNAVAGWYQKNNSATWSITSDARLKRNVVSLETGLSVVSALRPVEFDYIENDKHDIGFIAQEYQTVLPAQISEGNDGMLSLNQNLVPYLVKAIQELKAEVDSLKQQLGK